MSNEFSYKGYSGSSVVSIEDACLHGRILFIDDLITYEGNTVKELEASFKTAVDGYISYCAQTGKPANKPYSGSFNVRVGSNSHRAAAQCAKRNGITLNEFVRRAVERETNQTGQSKVIIPEIIANPTVTHGQQVFELPLSYGVKEQSWPLSQEKPRLN